VEEGQDQIPPTSSQVQTVQLHLHSIDASSALSFLW